MRRWLWTGLWIGRVRGETATPKPHANYLFFVMLSFFVWHGVAWRDDSLSSCRHVSTIRLHFSFVLFFGRLSSNGTSGLLFERRLPTKCLLWFLKLHKQRWPLFFWLPVAIYRSLYERRGWFLRFGVFNGFEGSSDLLCSVYARNL